MLTEINGDPKVQEGNLPQIVDQPTPARALQQIGIGLIADSPLLPLKVAGSLGQASMI
jgi:hypothetical protein